MSPDASDRTTLAANWFPLTARLFAVALFAFFAAAFVVSAFDLDLGGTVMGPIRWGSDAGRPYELMISTIYLVWSVFLWRAADDPATNKLFMDFSVAGNAAHFTVMAVMAFTFDGEQQHIHGDVPLGFLGLLGFTIVWLLARPAVTS